MTNLRTAILSAAISFLSAGTVAAQNFEVPFRAEDFDKDNSKVYWGRAVHSASGVQQFGYDLGALRYDATAKKWTEFTSDAGTIGDHPDNDKFVIYGKPIYAMRDGKVIACWRNAPQNPGRNTKHAKID